MSENKNPNSKTGRSIIKRALFSIAAGSSAGTAVFAASAFLISYILYRQNAGSETFGIFILIPAALSGFTSGFISAAVMRSNGMMIGFLSALPVFFVFAAAAVFISKGSIALTGWTALGVITVCAAAAGILSVNKKPKKKKSKKKSSSRASAR